MRYDKIITFYTSGDRRYDPKAHGYVGGAKQVGVVLANVTDLGTDRSAQVLGNIDTKAKVIRLIAPAPDKWDWLTIGDDGPKYRLTTSRVVLKGNTLIVGEDNG